MGDIVAGRFELIDLLGSGAAGSVWRAWDHKERRYLAAKVLKHSDSESIMRFIREARTIIEHDHVLVPRNWVGEDDRVLFTTDLVRGGSLAALANAAGPLPERWVLEIGRQTAQALASIHAQGFVHRDVKPANLLLEPTGVDRPHVWLADFGIATTLDSPRLTATHLVLGTPGYLALEAYQGALPAPSQDMWALGAVLRHLATGETPPPAPDADAWRDAGPRWSMSTAFAALVAELLATDPSARPTAEEAVVRMRQLSFAAPTPTQQIEVRDQIGWPPLGWGPDGPVGRSDAGTPGPQHLGPVGSGNATALDPPTRVHTTGGQTQVEARRLGAASAVATPHDSEAAATAPQHERGQTLPWLMILLGMVLIAVCVATW